MTILYIIRGLPGSGKSTIARSMGIPHFEADMFFVNGFNPSKLAEAHAWCLAETKKALALGDCVVSNTFTRHWEMAPYIDAAKKAGAAVNIIVTTGSYPNIHDVPDSTIEKMRSRWEE